MFHHRAQLDSVRPQKLFVAAGTDITTNLVHQWWLDDTHISAGFTTADDSVVTSPEHGSTGSGVINSHSGAPSGATYPLVPNLDGSVGAHFRFPSLTFNWNAGSHTVAFWLYLVDNTAPGANSTRATYFALAPDAADTNMIRILNNTSGGGGPGSVAIACPTGTIVASSPAGSVPSASWKHIAYTKGASAKIYIDGLLSGGGATAAASGISAVTHTIGSLVPEASGGDGSINGRMYGFHIYTRELTAADVLALKNAP